MNPMSEIISKISSYNIFNYLFPGVIFIYFLNNFTSYFININNIIYFLFLSYFLWLVISRFWSFLEKILLLPNKEKYENFLIAEKKDKKINILLQELNMYRTLFSLFILVIFVKIYEYISIKCNFLSYNFYIVVFLFILIFYFSYKKQNKYLIERIKYSNSTFIKKLVFKIFNI